MGNAEERKNLDNHRYVHSITKIVNSSRRRKKIVEKQKESVRISNSSAMRITVRYCENFVCTQCWSQGAREREG